MWQRWLDDALLEIREVVAHDQGPSGGLESPSADLRLGERIADGIAMAGTLAFDDDGIKDRAPKVNEAGPSRPRLKRHCATLNEKWPLTL